MNLVPPSLPAVDPATLRRAVKPVGEGAGLGDEDDQRRAPQPVATRESEDDAPAEEAAGPGLPAPDRAPELIYTVAHLSVLLRAERAPGV